MIINSKQPFALRCDLLLHPDKTTIDSGHPSLGWQLSEGEFQSAYQIEMYLADKLLWDSGCVDSDESVCVFYDGEELRSQTAYKWRVRVWVNSSAEASDWSEFQSFKTGLIQKKQCASVYPTVQSRVTPEKVCRNGEKSFFYDFAKAAFGTVEIKFPKQSRGEVIVHLGEKLTEENRIDRTPPGMIRYQKIPVSITPEKTDYPISIIPDERNTGSQAILMPESIGEVLPFRYCEIEIVQGEIEPISVTRLEAHQPFDDREADFECDNDALNQVWALCKHTIKATTFAGLYVDGDRERIPYESDAYINQLGHYFTQSEYSMARATCEYLIFHPTWPTEWILHTLLIAWDDYMFTGNPQFLERYYDELKAKTLTVLAGNDGLISTHTGLVTEDVLKSIHLEGNLRDIVDWPPAEFDSNIIGERDNHEMMPVNTVVNAFYYKALGLFVKIAQTVNKKNDADVFMKKAEEVCDSFNSRFFDSDRGIYRDGHGSKHASLHSNMMALNFDLVPADKIESVIDFIKSRKMACSVYGAQYLLESLFKYNQADYCVELMTNESDRGWLNMIDVGSTMTLEAWDWKYKNYLDWNHAWGAAPANIIPRFIVGFQPLTPGCSRVKIAPKPSKYIKKFKAKIPTIRGTVEVDYDLSANNKCPLNVRIPGNMKAEIVPPMP